MDIKEFGILGGGDVGKHWYYYSKALAMRKFLIDAPHTSVLDVGAGSQFFSKELLQNCSTSEAYCVDTSYTNDWNDIHNDKPLLCRRAVGNVNSDLVLLMDVLEHVDDDIGLLKDYVNKVPSGAFFLISVPAFQFLWSGHDIFLQHKRRYTLRQLENVVLHSGLIIKRSAYFYSFIFPIAMIIRTFNNFIQKISGRGASTQLTKHSLITNEILKTISYLELLILPINRLVGLTIFCLAKKP